MAKFPVNYPVSRESHVETGSYLTAHTTIQSLQTTDFRGDSKEAVLAGIIAGSFLLFRLWGHWWSFEPIFGFPSLHPKIPFPAAGFRMVHDRSVAQELGLWTQNYRPAMTPPAD
jgi:hypothetical protein